MQYVFVMVQNLAQWGCFLRFGASHKVQQRVQDSAVRYVWVSLTRTTSLVSFLQIGPKKGFRLGQRPMNDQLGEGNTGQNQPKRQAASSAQQEIHGFSALPCVTE